MTDPKPPADDDAEAPPDYAEDTPDPDPVRDTVEMSMDEITEALADRVRDADKARADAKKKQPKK